MKYMGLDISSSTIGISIIDVDEENLKFKIDCIDYYKPPKKGTIFSRLLTTKQWISEKLDGYNVDDVVIEDISEHMSNKSTSKTIITLAVFNRAVGTAVLEKKNKEPHLMNVNTIRSILRPKGYNGKLKKEDVPEVISKICGVDFPYVYKKNGSKADESCDMADSAAVAIAYAILKISENKDGHKQSVSSTRTGQNGKQRRRKQSVPKTSSKTSSRQK